VPFGLWVRRITINTIIDEFRKKKLVYEQTELVDFDDPENEADRTVLNNYVQKMDAAQIQAMIDTLPETSRRVFNLFAIDGFSHKEIAAMAGISEGTSKWHVNFARTKLKELISIKLTFKSSKAS
jgi:RNA polymerase sigma-70 factor (ECF subfamily)